MIFNFFSWFSQPILHTQLRNIANMKTLLISMARTVGDLIITLSLVSTETDSFITETIL